MNTHCEYSDAMVPFRIAKQGAAADTRNMLHSHQAAPTAACRQGSAPYHANNPASTYSHRSLSSSVDHPPLTLASGCLFREAGFFCVDPPVCLAFCTPLPGASPTGPIGLE